MVFRYYLDCFLSMALPVGLSQEHRRIELLEHDIIMTIVDVGVVDSAGCGYGYDTTHYT